MQHRHSSTDTKTHRISAEDICARNWSKAQWIGSPQLCALTQSWKSKCSDSTQSLELWHYVIRRRGFDNKVHWLHPIWSLDTMTAKSTQERLWLNKHNRITLVKLKRLDKNHNVIESNQNPPTIPLDPPPHQIRLLHRRMVFECLGHPSLVVLAYLTPRRYHQAQVR